MAEKKRPAHDVILDFIEDRIKNINSLKEAVSAQLTFFSTIETLLEILRTMFLLQEERQKILFALREFQQDLDDENPIQGMLQITIIELMDDVH